jgi:hypothetical protein
VTPLVAVAAAAGAAVLALSSTGSAVVAAVLLAVAVGDRRAGFACVLAVAAVAVRFSTVTFDDLAGIQSVLGPAGIVGPPTAAASAWLAAAAVVLSVRRPAVADGSTVAPAPDGWPVPTTVPPVLHRVLLALAGGALAAALVAGPGPSDLVVRAGATAAGLVVALVVMGTDRWRPVVRVRPLVAVLVAVVAVVAAAWPA